MRYTFVLLAAVMLFVLSGCGLLNSGEEIQVRCVPGYEYINGECQLVQNHNVDSCEDTDEFKFECTDFPVGSIYYENQGVYIPYADDKIGEYIVYHKSEYGVICDYFRALDIIYDFYYTADTRYGYEAIYDRSCFVELYIHHDGKMVTLEDAFERQHFDVSDIDQSNLSFTIREQSINTEVDKTLWGKSVYFGSIIKPYTEHEFDVELYYYDYTGYTCNISSFYTGVYFVTDVLTLYENILTGTNCGSGLYVYEHIEGNDYLIPFHRSEIARLNMSDFKEILSPFNTVTARVNNDLSSNVSNVYVYEVMNGVVSETPIDLKYEFEEDFVTRYERSTVFGEINQTDIDELFDFYARYHQETDEEYLVEVTFYDDSSIVYRAKNNILYDEINDEFLIDCYYYIYDDSTGFQYTEKSGINNLIDYIVDVE